jgi:hypothetical protein
MFNCSHCQECGKKLLNAFFCYACEMTFCSPRCLNLHKAKHRAQADPAAGSSAQPDPLVKAGRAVPEEHPDPPV